MYITVVGVKIFSLYLNQLCLKPKLKYRINVLITPVSCLFFVNFDECINKTDRVSSINRQVKPINAPSTLKVITDPHHHLRLQPHKRAKPRWHRFSALCMRLLAVMLLIGFHLLQNCYRSLIFRWYALQVPC